MTKYPDHPIATVFPLMTGDEYWALVDDVKTRGLEQAIVLLDEQILDGRNRSRACVDAGVEPHFTTYGGDDPLGYVISVNLKRRHLNESQRAIVAARLAKYTHGGNRSKAHNSALSRAKAAALLKVGERTVDTAAAILDDQDLVNAVNSGDIGVTKAEELTRLTKEQQRDALEELRNQPRKRSTPEQRDRMMTREVRLTESDLTGLIALYEHGSESDVPRIELGANVLKRLCPAVAE